MKLKVVVVDLEVPPRFKRWALRIGIPVAIVGGAAVAFAAAPLKSWSSGDMLTAVDLNSNFASLDRRLAALEGSYGSQAADGGPAPGGLYCGVHTNNGTGWTGAIGGLDTANTLCRTVPGCSPTTAHMCTVEENNRSRNLGLTMTAGWIRAGVSSTYSGFTFTDCSNWTSTNNNAWENLGWDACSTARNIACCN